VVTDGAGLRAAADQDAAFDVGFMARPPCQVSHAQPTGNLKPGSISTCTHVVNGQVEVPAGGQLKVPAPRGCLAGFACSASSCSGLFHPVGVAVGDDDVAVVQEPVEHADGGGVLGQEPAPGFERPV
jgi:hypothetical protein